MKKHLRNRGGITLIALVVTIVVLIILATISINAVLGENGIIRRAEQARQHQANAEASDNAAMDELAGYLANVMGEDGGSEETPENPTVAVTGVSLDKTSETIGTNETLQLTATVAPSDATNKNVTWSSDTPSVATVSQTGLVTAVSAGSTTITVTTEDGAKTASCSITVSAPEPEGMDASDIKTSASTYYGTKVNYTNAEGQAVAGQEWEIFFADDNNIYLITKASLTDPEYNAKNLSGAVSATTYNSGSSMLTADATKGYFPAAEKWFNWPTSDSSFASTNSNMKATLFMLDSINVWNATYHTAETTDYAIGSPTLEMLCKSVNDVKGNTNYVAAPESATGYPVTISSGLTNGTVWNHGDFYWLACPSSSYTSDVRVVASYDEYVGTGNYNLSYGFRPVVCLTSGVTLEAVEQDGVVTEFNIVEAQ